MFAIFERELAVQRRHVRVLQSVRDNGPVTVEGLAADTDATVEEVRQSLAVLEDEEAVAVERDEEDRTVAVAEDVQSVVGDIKEAVRYTEQTLTSLSLS